MAKLWAIAWDNGETRQDYNQELLAVAEDLHSAIEWARKNTQAFLNNGAIEVVEFTWETPEPRKPDTRRPLYAWNFSYTYRFVYGSNHIHTRRGEFILLYEVEYIKGTEKSG